MSSNKKEHFKLLLLIRNDAERLFDRLLTRKNEYIRAYSLKRQREHFKDIFYSRYKEISVAELKVLSEELIASLDQFYSRVDDFHWYLNHTEDMPVAVLDRAEAYIKTLKISHQTLQLYINAESELYQDLKLAA